MSHRVYPHLAGAALVALAFTARPLMGQDDARPALSVHGYLTQAFGITDRYQVMGITKDGTADYRRAAIVARYQVSPKDHFVVQVAHRRLGESPTNEFEDNVKLDMAFYERRFESGTSLRVGKIAMPFGIYNEMRYAGMLLPFYRAPYSVYSEGHYTSESLDGVGVTHRLRGGEPWETSVDLYGGTFSQLESATWSNDWMTQPPAYMTARLDSKDVLGAQLWVATPLDGVRLGAGGRRQKDFGGVYPRPDGSDTRIWTASVDATRERWQFRAERFRLETKAFEMTAQYAQAGVRVLPWMTVNAQTELSTFLVEYAPGVWDDFEGTRDNAVGLNVFVAPNAVLKLEAHGMKGFAIEQATDSRRPAPRSAYFITSFSVGF